MNSVKINVSIKADTHQMMQLLMEELNLKQSHVVDLAIQKLAADAGYVVVPARIEKRKNT